MVIPPSPVHLEPIRGPGAWMRDSFPDPSVWTERLSSEFWQELGRAIEGKHLESIRADDFTSLALADDVRRLHRELTQGRGFLVVRGLPVEHCGEEEASLLYWGLGALLGVPLPQNVRGDRFYSVRDEGYRIAQDYGAVGVRFSKTTEALHFHTDSAPALMGNTPDVVGLLALQVAKEGGASALVSAQSVHNVLLQERPDYLARLYAPYHFDRRAELRPGEPCTLQAPVFIYQGALAVRYFRFYIPIGHELAHEPLTAADIEPLDYLDAVMNRPEFQVHFEMQPGDIQLVSNRFLLHSRTAFVDHSEPARRRHLKRLWLAWRDSSTR